MPNTLVNGRKIELFLGGDFKNIDVHLGKQGSTATYPEEKDLKTLQHLQKHPKEPHTLQNCFFEQRTPEHYSNDYNEYLTDDRANAGKMHYSVVDTLLFPVKR